MKVAQKRPLIAFMQDSFQVSERRACCVLPLIRSSCRRTSTRKDPVVLRQRIRELAESRVRYGYRRIHILLQREGFKVGKDRVHRLYRQEGLSLRRKRPRRHTSAARRVERPEPQQMNQSWSMDFVSDALFDGLGFRVFTWVDNFSRECLAIRPAPNSWTKLSTRTASQNEFIWTTVPSSSQRRWTPGPIKRESHSIVLDRENRPTTHTSRCSTIEYGDTAILAVSAPKHLKQPLSVYESGLIPGCRSGYPSIYIFLQL